MPLFQFRPKARRGQSEVISGLGVDQVSMQPVKAQMIGSRGGSFNLGYANLHDTNKVTDSAAVGAGASVTLWSPVAGNVVQLGYVVLSVTVAQLFQLTVSGTAYISVLMPANTPVVLYQSWPGFFAYPTAAVIAIKNAGGVASDIHCNLWGNEVFA